MNTSICLSPGRLLLWISLLSLLACRAPVLYPTTTPASTSEGATTPTTTIPLSPGGVFTPTSLTNPTPSPSPAFLTPTTPTPPTAPRFPSPTVPTEGTSSTPTLTTVTPPNSPAPSGQAAKVLSKLPRDQPVIALTFDCGADRGFASDILDILAQEGVRATFGMTGSWARANPDLVARMLQEGHRLINHSDTHPSFTGYSTNSLPLSRAERASEIRGAERAVALITGSEATMRPYFRPPYGDYDEQLLQELPELGYTTVVMWTIDSLGWRGIPPEEVVQRVMAEAEAGAIVLLHVGRQSTDAAALPELIRSLQSAGYSFTTID